MPLDNKSAFWDLQGPNKISQLLVLGCAEALGTGIILFIGCGSVHPSATVLDIASAFGFAILIAVMGIGHISGAHVNPAVSLAAVIIGKISVGTFLVYVVSQCIGALIGTLLITALSPRDAAAECVTILFISPIKGVLFECILTAILVLLVCSVWDPRNSTKHDSAPIRFGCAVVALVLGGARFTGCSMNPARSLAPVIISGNWKNHWVYWLGPLSGGALTGFVYKFLFLNHYLKTEKSQQERDPNSEEYNRKIDIVLENVSK